MNLFVLEHGMTLAMECKAFQHVVLLAKADKYMHVYFYSYNIIGIHVHMAREFAQKLNAICLASLRWL